jgi:hypothetical protein
MSMMGGALPTHGAAVAAVANDRNVIDAEDQWNAGYNNSVHQVPTVRNSSFRVAFYL